MLKKVNIVTPCISVIMPCYNVEKYLEEALESVLAQTLENIEIILVDDGSPDNCSNIIEKYSKKDQRIKPIYKKNGGYGSAVNAGLEIATGEYIAILEPDDYIMEDYYYILYHEAKKDDLDVCGVNAYCEVRDMELPRLIQTPWIENPDYLSYENINELFSLGSVGITLKIYKKNFLNKNRISLKEDLKAYHDVPFVAEVMLKATKTRIIIGCGYFYRKDNLFSTTKNKSNFFNIINSITHVLHLVNKYAKRDSRKSALLGFCVSHLLFYYKRILATTGDNSISQLLKDMMLEIVSSAKNIKINIIHQSFLLTILPKENFLKLEYIQGNIVKFDACPSFDITYFKDQKNLSNMIAEISFFIYYAITLNDIHYVTVIRNKLYMLLSTFIGIKGCYIQDYIHFYIDKGWFMFSRDWNTNWYLAFMSYMNDSSGNFNGRIYESLSHGNSSNTTIQFIPRLSNLFDNSYSLLSDTLRKSKIIQNRSNNNALLFKKYISNKSIAIIGNAPSELGNKNGKEIDKHNIVIRFNNFSTEEKFSKDYGKKTNVWVTTPSIETLFYPNDFHEFDFIITPELNFMISQERIEILYNYILAGGNFQFINSIDCRREYNITIPSIGLYFLFYLKENINLLGKISLYGFEPLSAKNESRHYFKDDSAKTVNLRFHDWDKEAILINDLKNIFNKHNKGLK